MSNVENYSNEDVGWKPPSNSEPKIEKSAPGKTNNKKKRNEWRILATILILAFFTVYVYNNTDISLDVFLTLTAGLFFILYFLWKKPSRFKKTSAGKKDDILLKGIVRGFNQGTENLLSGRQKFVWNFRIECFDDQGNLRNTIPVKMKGDGLQGTIHDGDEIKVSHWKKGELLQTDRIKNLTSGIEVRTINHDIGQKFIKWIVFLIIIAVIVFAITQK